MIEKKKEKCLANKFFLGWASRQGGLGKTRRIYLRAPEFPRIYHLAKASPQPASLKSFRSASVGRYRRLGAATALLPSYTSSLPRHTYLNLILINMRLSLVAVPHPLSATQREQISISTASFCESLHGSHEVFKTRPDDDPKSSSRQCINHLVVRTRLTFLR